MSFFDAYKAYNGLDSEQKTFLKEKRIDASHSPDVWLAMIGGAARYDQLGDSLRKTFGWIGALALIFGFILLFAKLAIAFVVLLPLAIIAFIFYGTLKRLDLPDSIHD